MKTKLTTAPILKQYKTGCKLILDTDASDKSIGAVLSQIQDDKECVLAYYSKTLSRTERNYCFTRRELLAVVRAIKQFKHYLSGEHFIVRTDHASLIWLKRFKAPEGQVARWLEAMQDYDMEIIHRSGNQHSNADALSRRPCLEKNCGYCERLENREVNNEVYGCRLVNVVDFEWSEVQNKDNSLNKIKIAMESGIQPTWDDLRPMTLEGRLLWQQWKYLEVSNGILLRRRSWAGKNLTQILVPQVERKMVMEELHDSVTSGHLGSEKTFRRVQERFYWPGYRSDVNAWCKTCERCCKRNGPKCKIKPALKVRLSGFPFERVALDLMGPLPLTKNGNRYILVVGDYFTKWTEAYALPNMEAKSVAKIMIEQFVSRFGVPFEIHSDQGRSFESVLFRDLCELMGVKKTRTTPFYPQSDGMIERFNRTLGNMLAKFANEKQDDWDEHIPLIMLAYRTAEHKATGVSPSKALMGFEPRLPIDLLVGKIPDRSYVSQNTTVLELADKLASVRQGVLVSLQDNAKKMKLRFDRNIKEEKLIVGDLVWVWSPQKKKGRSPKLQSYWLGPVRVVDIINHHVCKVMKESGKRTQNVHRSRLWKATKHHGIRQQPPLETFEDEKVSEREAVL